jgi:predicted Zn finger-like uncharacterized protein
LTVKFEILAGDFATTIEHIFELREGHYYGHFVVGMLMNKKLGIGAQMVIECKACSKRFRLDETLLKSSGSRVRCSKCGEVFKAYPAETSTIPEVVSEIPTHSEGTRPIAEKRNSHRIPVSIPALCNSMDSDGHLLDLHIGVIKEVSQTGVAIDLFHSSISEVISLSFIGIDNKDVQINGKVRHFKPTHSGKMRFGVSLQGSPFDIKQFVSQAVRTYHQSGNDHSATAKNPGGQRSSSPYSS